MTNSSGFWQDGTNWSGHTPPDITSFIKITNDTTKTITLNASTPASTLTVQKLTLSAPPGTTNTVLLSSLGIANPLVFQTGLELDDGADLHIVDSAIQTLLTNDHVNIDGTLRLDSGLIDFGDTTVTARVGRVTSGTLAISGGTVSAGAVHVGGLTNSTGFLRMNGGTLTIASVLSAGRNLGTTGTVSVLGGQLIATNDDTRIGDEGNGEMVVSNATAYLNNLQVGRDANGSVTVGTGGVIKASYDSVLGRFAGVSGSATIAGGQLVLPASQLYVGRSGSGQLTLASGSVQAGALLVAADPANSAGASGNVTLTGGNLNLGTNLLIGIPASSAQVVLSGGAVVVTNGTKSGRLNLSNGTLTLNGASVTVDVLQVTNASSQFSFQSGTIDTKSTTIGNGAAFVVGDGVSPATLHLSGGTHIFANGLVISSNATLSGCGTIVGSIVNHGTIATNCGSVTLPPTITVPPQSQTVAQGASVTFTVTATGTPPLSYQWNFKGAAIPGATNNSYTRNNVQPADAGDYTVVVSNTTGPVTSPVATLTVLVPPVITAQPQSQTVVQGTNVTFTVTATGTSPLSYEWSFKGAAISGATNNSYTRDNVQPADAGDYTVKVSSLGGSVTSAAATLTVLGPPVITAQPQSQTVVQGTNVTFTVTATGTAPLSYQWSFKGTAISGATNNSYTRNNVQSADAGNYTVLVSNAAGSAPSSAATLTLVVPPSITAQPQSQTVAQGNSATFTVTATGSSPLSYQWSLNGTTISGATNNTYTRSNVQSADAGDYTVLVSNPAGSAQSAAAVLTVTQGQSQITLTLQTQGAGQNQIAFNSTIGSVYTLQFKNKLDDQAWSDLLPSTNGTGNQIILNDSTVTGPSRFYRVKIQ